MTHTFNNTIFREYDIRGTFNKNFFATDAYEIGRRFATLLKDFHPTPMVCVARDGRLSSPDLFASLIEGLRECGADILDIGVGPTPMLYYATKITPAVAGIMVTGSHNPPEDNGLKITLKDTPFFGKQIQDLKNVRPIGAAFLGSVEFIDIREQYIKRLLRDYPKTGLRKLRIAWDSGNGAAGEIVELLTPFLEADSFLLNTAIDGTFPAHHPDPTVEANLKQLQQEVAQHNCDIGIAFDGDADRIGVIDSQGRILWGDQLLCILAEDILKSHPGAKIIGDVKSSQALFDHIVQLKGIPVMAKTGHSNIKMLIKEIGAALAGEVSGHIFYADGYYGYDDAIYTAIRLLTFLQTHPLSLTEIFNALPRYFATPELRLPCPDEHKFELVDHIHEDLKKQGIDFISLDGVRVKTEAGWWLIRASNTQPLIIARCEAYTQENLPPLVQHMKTFLTPYISPEQLEKGLSY